MYKSIRLHKKIMKKYFLFLIINLFVFGASILHAKSKFNHTHIELLTRKDGLRNNSISTILQNKEGFIWLGTDVGITRYDGLNFHNFNIWDKEPFHINSLYETSNNLLYGEAKNTKQIICLSTYTHQRLKVVNEKEEALNGIDRFGVVNNHLFAIKDSSLVELDETLTDDKVILRASAINSIKQPIGLFCEKEHLIVPTTENKIFIYHVKTKKVESFDCSGLPFKHVKHVENIRIFNEYIVFYDAHIGLILYNPTNHAWKQLTKEPLSDFSVIDEHTFIIATWNKLKILEFDNKNYQEAAYQTLWEIKESSSYLPIMQNRINKLHFDKLNNVLWVCTSGGLIKINFKSNLIQNIVHNQNIKRINGLAEDAHGYIWISTQLNGIYKSTSNQVDENLTFERWNESNPESCYALYKDRLGNIWLGDKNGKIMVHNPNDGKTSTIALPNVGISPNIEHIAHLFMSSRNRLWIAAEEGLTIYDYNQNQILQYIPYTSEFGKVTAICEDGSGVMWVGSEKGLFKATANDNNTFSFSGGFEESAGLTANKVLALYLNSYNQLYATYNDKILQIDGKSKQVIASKVLLHSLSSGDVACIIDDYSGNTWLGTKSGIITISNSSTESYLYELPQTFYKVIQLKDNRLLWAHSNGLSYFNPDLMKKEMNSQKFFISDIEINYNMISSDTQKHEVGTLLNNHEKLTLEHNENNIKVFITDLCYNDITSKIEYRLLPNDTTWIASYNNYVQLNDVAPGEYRLEVRPPFLTEDKGKITSLDIVIKKHWSNTSLAYIGYVSLLILLASLVQFYLKHRKSIARAYMAKENKFNEQIHEIHENEKLTIQQNELRYSLAKEMYTPLSLIVAPLKEILNKPETPKPLNEKIRTAHQNAIGLQNICNLLKYIHEKNNDNRQKLQIAPYQASELADEAMRSSYDMLKSGAIKVFYNREKRIDSEIWVDRERIHFVLINTLSNAYRHTNYSGLIWFSVQNSKIGGQPYCLFTIKDNGKEYAKKSEVNYMSDENYTGEDSIFLGWDIIKKDLQAHGGNLKITCKEGEGTEVVIHLPLGKEHFENNPNVEFVTPKASEENQETPILTTDESTEPAIPKAESIEPTVIERPESKLKLLIIEDNADIRLYLKVMFAKTYQVLLASNGEEGIRTAEKEIPNLIITDIAMPVMDGFECCKRLKENLKTCHIPIIILTAMAGDENIVKGTELGADDYILKPFNPDILRSKVKNLIKSRTELKKAYTKFLTNEPNTDNKVNTEENNEEKDPLIQKILDIVNDNLQNPDFSVKKLADMLNLSQPTLYRKVKQLTGYTIIELIRGVRIKRSAELLKTKKYSIQEVSEMVGYNDISTFRKHFIDLYGTTPSTYSKE